MFRRVWAIAWPMMLSNLTTPLLGLVDTAVMGHLSDSRYLAAVAVGGTLFSSLYWGVGFLKAGTTGLAAQAVGQEDSARLRTVVWQALLTAAVLGLLFMLLQIPLRILGQAVFAPPTESVAQFQLYFQIRIWGAPAALVTLALVGWFVGNHNTRVPLVLMLVTNLTNIILNIIFVMGLGLKADGVAWGTLISEYLGLGVGAYFLVKALGENEAATYWPEIFSLTSYRQFFGLHRDYFIRTLFLTFTLVFFTRQGALMGKDVLAANEILKTFMFIISLSLDGYAHAAEAIAGSAWAGRRRSVFKACVRVVLLWSLITALGLSVLFGFGGRLILSLLTDLPALLALAHDYLIWVVVLPIISVWSFVFDGIYIGMTQTRIMRNNMIFTVLLVFLPIWFVLQPLANHGLWLAMMSFYISRGLGLGWHFYQNFWRRAW
jgi:MATE family multidrug resistance protein